MENIKNKLDKKDISYIMTLLFFAIIAMFRFFDKKLRNHGAVFEFMEDYPTAIVMMFLYFIILFVLIGVVITFCKPENKKTMYYLTAFLSVFAFPMFLPKYYFGNMDMYAWMIATVCCVLFVIKKAQFLTVPLCALMMYISPMSFFTCGCLIVLLNLYSFLVKGEKNELWIVLFSLVAGGIGAMSSLHLNGVNVDAQSVLPIEKFVMAIVLLSPYLFIAFFFFKGVLKRSDQKKKLAWILLVVGAFPTAISNYVIEDYARALVYMFLYFIIAIICLISVKEETAELQMDETKELIKKYVPIPVLVIAYPLLITCFWIAGPITLYKERFLGN